MAYPSSSDPAGEKPGNDTTSLSRKCQTSAEWTPWENSIKRASLLLFPTENPLVGRAGRASRLGRGCGQERRGGHKDEGLVADKGVDQTNKHFRDNGRQVSRAMRKGITNMEREKTRRNPEMLDRN